MSNLVAQTTITVKGEDKQVQIYKLNASEGIVIGTKLLKFILPVLGGFADEMFNEEKVESPKTFSEMAQRILMQMDNVDMLAIIKKLLHSASIDRKPVDFDEYFMANYGELFLVLEFALKENFQSFFEVAGLRTRFFQAMGVMTEDQAESDEQ